MPSPMPKLVRSSQSQRERFDGESSLPESGPNLDMLAGDLRTFWWRSHDRRDKILPPSFTSPLVICGIMAATCATTSSSMVTTSHTSCGNLQSCK